MSCGRADAPDESAVTDLDTETAAMAAGVTRRTIQLWIKARLLVNVGTARAARVRLEDVRRAASQEATAARRTRRPG